MKGYLIDTNVISELRKGDRANAGVKRWFVDHADDELWLSVLVVAELQRGANLLRRRDERAAERLDTWLTSLVEGYVDRILPVDLAVAHTWASLGVPDPLPVVDGLLAATAIAQDLNLVTRNIPDLDRSGVALTNPFD